MLVITKEFSNMSRMGMRSLFETILTYSPNLGIIPTVSPKRLHFEIQSSLQHKLLLKSKWLSVSELYST